MYIKDNVRIIADPIQFRKAFFDQTTKSGIDDEYESLFKIILYYIWQGVYKTRASMLQGRTRMDFGNLCIATFISFLPIIQNLRLGFPSDAMILLRALMERIALLGYLQENPNHINKYNNGDRKIRSDAMAWAKTHSLENWMRLYSVLSNLAHPKIEGTAGYILSKNIFSESFRLSMPPTKIDEEGINAEVLGMVLYGLMAVDPIAAKVVGDGYINFSQPDKELMRYISQSDLVKFTAFLNALVKKYGSS